MSDLFDLFKEISPNGEQKPNDYPEIINIHWYGGVDKLPPNSIYMGSGSIYGNPFERHGKTRIDVCEQHKEMLALRLEKDKEFEHKMMNDLKGKLLACFCKNKHKEIPCHCDNYAEEYYKRFKAGWFSCSEDH